MNGWRVQVGWMGDGDRQNQYVSLGGRDQDGVKWVVSSMLGAPVDQAFVDEEHDSSIGHNTHQVSTQTAVQSLSALLGDDEL